MKPDRVVISTHNPTMRTALRLVALTAPLWAIYIPGLFLGIFGFFLHQVIFDPNERVFWLLAAFFLGSISTTLLLLNTLILDKSTVVFPPLKSETLPIAALMRVAWHWDKGEREAYLRFSLPPQDSDERDLEIDWSKLPPKIRSLPRNVDGRDIDIHWSRLSPKKLALLKDALKKYHPSCEIFFEPEDLEDLISFRERFTKPKNLSLSDEGQKLESIDIPYNPHEQFDKFFQSLGANEKYFWYCWMTVMLVPCILKIPDVIWGIIADLRHTERFVGVPDFIVAIDQFTSGAWAVGTFGLAVASSLYYNAAAHPFGIVILMAMAILALVGLGMFTFQPNGIVLKRRGIEIFFHWKKFVLFKVLIPWRDITAFKLDQCGDMVNPEKWRMQIKTTDRRTVNLKVQAIKGAEARETLLKNITEMAPQAMQDSALIRALMPAQKESYTELWLQSLATPPKRNRLAPLSEGQKLHSGRYVVERQLAVGGQGVAYVALDTMEGSILEARSPGSAEGPILNTVGPGSAESRNAQSPGSAGFSRQPSQAMGQQKSVVLKEFVLPVYTSRAVRKQALERFENEARILRDLDHPQIVKLVDYFLEDHRAYLVLEHIDGLSLRQIVETGGALRPEQIKDMAVQMCTVLDYLHSLSPPVVHRDFTPDNLILNRDGKLVLIDFNVAQQRQWTTTGTVVGKHAYLPPEQFRGQPSTQSDLYAMGATLFFLCTGEDPEPLTCSHPISVNHSVSPAFDQVVANLTAIETEDRYQTIADVKIDLESEPTERIESIIIADSEPTTLKTASPDKQTVTATKQEQNG